MGRRRRRNRPTLWKGAAAGLAGGLAGAWAMTVFQSGWSKASDKLKSGEHLPENRRREREQEPDSEDATMKAAARLASLAGRELTYEQKQKAGPLVHYVFGSSMGVLYGVSGELAPAARTGFGTLFGTGVFLGGDEVAVPALGLSKKPTAYPLSTHLYGLASHLVYGLTTEAVRRSVRRAL